MQKKIRKSVILLFSAIIAVLLFGCVFMFTPKITAHADAEESGQSTDLYWGLKNGVLTLSSDGTNPATPNLYSTTTEGTLTYPTWFSGAGITSVTVDTYAYAPQSMENWFRNCTGLTSVDLSNLDTSQVTNMGYMFCNCTALISVELGNLNTTQVTDMEFMFYNCKELTSLNLSSFNTSKVEYMGLMFSGCSGLTSLDLSNFNTANVAVIWYMFDGCTNLATLDISLFDTSKITNEDYVENIFSNCDSLKEIKTPKIIGEVALPLPDSETKWWNGTADIITGSIASADAGKIIYRHAECTAAEAVRENEVAATCAVGGSYDEVVYCSICKTELNRTSHTTDINSNAHSYDEWTVVKQATEAEEGEERRICANDNTHYETRTIPKLTPSTPTPTPAQKKSYVWICWLLFPLALAVGGTVLGMWLYKKNKEDK